uniref:Uncharacterized protein n=1 Tax=Magallana gigas TaxID=29159 RepID=K1RG98_MAGGI
MSVSIPEGADSVPTIDSSEEHFDLVIPRRTSSGENQSDVEHHHDAYGPGLQPCKESTGRWRKLQQSSQSANEPEQMGTSKLSEKTQNTPKKQKSK